MIISKLPRKYSKRAHKTKKVGGKASKNGKIKAILGLVFLFVSESSIV